MCTGLRIKENKEVYEGEVTELTPEETEAPGGGFQKAISHVVIGLRTVRRGPAPQSRAQRASAAGCGSVSGHFAQSALWGMAQGRCKSSEQPLILAPPVAGQGHEAAEAGPADLRCDTEGESAAG